MEGQSLMGNLNIKSPCLFEQFMEKLDACRWRLVWCLLFCTVPVLGWLIGLYWISFKLEPKNHLWHFLAVSLAPLIFGMSALLSRLWQRYPKEAYLDKVISQETNPTLKLLLLTHALLDAHPIAVSYIDIFLDKIIFVRREHERTAKLRAYAQELQRHLNEPSLALDKRGWQFLLRLFNGLEEGVVLGEQEIYAIHLALVEAVERSRILSARAALMKARRWRVVTALDKALQERIERCLQVLETEAQRCGEDYLRPADGLDRTTLLRIPDSEAQNGVASGQR